MRPEDLQSPFKWKDRHILVQDRVWYVPDQFKDFNSFTFPGWNAPQLFTEQKPICLEYCSGNGAWIASKAQEQQEYNWVAVERKFDRVKKIWSKIKNHQLDNLLTVCGEGHQVTCQYIPSQSIHSVYINFPDPWPKRRHEKNRIVQVPFLLEISRILEGKGTLSIVTDDPLFSKWTIEQVLKSKHFESIYEEPFYIHDDPLYGSSYFEDLWRQKGKKIFYHAFRKKVA